MNDYGLPSHYVNIKAIGEGGFSTVYRAMNETLGRFVAIKVLHDTDPDNAKRFTREARAMGSLSSHPNIVTVYDAGRTERGQPYLVMELMGGSLNPDPDSGPRNWTSSAAVGVAMAGALETAHQHGILHRDVKPSNILLTAQGEPALGDFGLATMRNAAQTEVGRAFTPTHVPPELLEGARATAASDIYSLASTLYELTTGLPPFHSAEDESVFAMLQRISAEEPERPDDVSDAFWEVLARGLAKAPSERHDSAEKFGQALQTALELDGKVPPEMIIAVASVEAAAADHLASEPIQPQPHGDYGTAPRPTRSSKARPPPTPYSDTVFIGRIDVQGDSEPRNIGPYTVLETIAKGKTGPLYKVYDPIRSRNVALKLIEVHDAKSRARLKRGTAAWLDLSHPNLLQVFNLHPPHAGQPGYILMEFVEGVDLRGLPAVKDREIAYIGYQLASALDHLHSKGILHREMVPSNVRIDPVTYATTLLDSGLARPVAAPVDVTQIGEAVGELAYMAPEQQRGIPDSRGDIFGLGALLYELATGRPAMANSNLESMREEIRSHVTLHKVVKSSILRMLEPDPNHRFQTGSDAARSLKHLLPTPKVVEDPARVVVTLHGINTHAGWQRVLADVAHTGGLSPRLTRWNFGHFAVWRFLMPWARSAKIGWFRRTYSAEFGTPSGSAENYPTVIAHSFGTYILGNAMLRFSNIRFGKVILCGSILPRDFPWDLLFERGQVRHVRNEFGARDVWTGLVEYMVPGTGPSGLYGFSVVHPLLEQERFDYSHSEYFEEGHMRSHWLPFIERPVVASRSADTTEGRRGSRHPWGAFALYLALIVAIVSTVMAIT